MNMKKILFVAGATVLLGACTSKQNLLCEADTHFEDLEYHTASQKYNKYLAAIPNRKAEIRLAECYMHMNHYAEAEKAYSTIVFYPEASVQNKLQYAHILKHNKKYSEAAKWFVEYLLEEPKDLAVTNELRSCDSLNNYTRLSYQYTVHDPGFNQGNSDFGAVFYKNGLVFCSERPGPKHTSDISQWTGHPYLHLFFVEVSTEDNPVAEAGKKGGPLASYLAKKVTRYGEPLPFAPEIKNLFNEGPICFSKDEKTAYLTRNAIDKKNKPEKSRESVNNFEIYKMALNGSTWSEPELLSFDNKEYSVGHAALSKDEKRLYFVSDMPGGVGGTDIYYSEWANDKWGKPVNAGPDINTNENEMFPVIWVDHAGKEYLYFSSEGLPGMGGLDLYCASINDNKLGALQHLNAPLNSAGDDFGIIFDTDGLSGYFSSNRDKEDGTDRIFSFKKYVPEFYLDLVVYKKGTREPLANASVEIADNHAKREVFRTDEHGRIFQKIEKDSKLELAVSKENFFKATGLANNVGKVLSDTLKIALELEPIIINKAIRMENIYYDYNKWDIRSDAMPYLNSLVKLMKENPSIHIELSSHTDSRGSDPYNLKLSQKRAQSAVNYIISQGVAGERIYAKGYGESQPLNKCTNKVKCAEDEFQVNRRTEFKVVKVTNP